MLPKSNDLCSIFGCNKPRRWGAQVDILIGVTPEVVWPCEEHENFFSVADPSTYVLGYTFHGDVQLRLLKSTPAE